MANPVSHPPCLRNDISAQSYSRKILRGSTTFRVWLGSRGQSRCRRARGIHEKLSTTQPAGTDDRVDFAGACDGRYWRGGGWLCHRTGPEHLDPIAIAGGWELAVHPTAI